MIDMDMNIEVKRQEMMMLAEKHGLNASQTVKCSQELDSLLNHLQEYRASCNENTRELLCS
ncbi:aspartyl-phosphate phosphatase Spo0E family protein [Shouchella lonarensis]|uniref:Spo0E like sporulation regulatory protein n=1 Tax=Shouchella lonarensis TaxID=1464122 RepID=A0A1G6HGL6_9BACI|nr:aspartyl-phosphate phosphatase Spo0E family protein [Shouchella lonarensis]SDB92596.1 Spo0E like sporulation regulatory protein [Shouchella lonarensis]